MLAQLQGIEQEVMAEIDSTFEYNVVLLGDPGVGKTSLIQKVINNYNDGWSIDDSISSIGQEITKHLLFASSNDEIKATFVGSISSICSQLSYFFFSLTPRATTLGAL